MTDLEAQQSQRVRDRRIERVVELMPPAQILDDLPLTTAHEDAVLRHRGEVAAILDQTDDRLLVVVGPCSVHDVDAALEYAQRLTERASDLREELCVAMRVYFEKPRTTIGWKGLINDPHLDGTGDVNTGLRKARQLLREVLDLGLPIGCEFLDPITPQYISDLVAWGAIGARTTESQIHRQLALGPLDAGRLQEPHRRQRQGCGRRRARGRREARFRRHRRRTEPRRSCTPTATPTAT